MFHRIRRKWKEAVARFIHTSDSEIKSNPEVAVNLVPNEWHIVEKHLKARRILLDDQLIELLL